eukprot:tig00000615_g2537.t1
MPRTLMRQLSRHYAHVRMVGDRAEDSESEEGSGDEAEKKKLEAGRDRDREEGADADGDRSGAEGARAGPGTSLTAENLAAGPGAPRDRVSEGGAAGAEKPKRKSSKAASERSGSRRSRCAHANGGEEEEEDGKKEKKRRERGASAGAASRSTGAGSRSRVAPELAAAAEASSSDSGSGAPAARGRKRGADGSNPRSKPAAAAPAPGSAPLSMENLERLGAEAPARPAPPLPPHAPISAACALTTAPRPAQMALRHVALERLARRRAASPARQEPLLVAEAPDAAAQGAGEARPVSRGSGSASGSSGTSSARRRFLPEIETLLAPEAEEAPVAVIATDLFGEGAALPDASFASSASGSAANSPASFDATKVEPVSDGESSSCDTVAREKRAAARALSPPLPTGGILRNGHAHSRRTGGSPAGAASPLEPQGERRRSVVFDPEDLSKLKGASRGLHRRERDPATVKDPLAEILGAANMWAPPPELPLVPLAAKGDEEALSERRKKKKGEKKGGEEAEEGKGGSDADSEEERSRAKERKRKRAAEMAKPAVNNLLASLTRKYLSWFLIIAAVMSANFALCFFFMDQGKTASMEIKYGGTRRAVVRELAFLSRELYPARLALPRLALPRPRPPRPAPPRPPRPAPPRPASPRPAPHARALGLAARSFINDDLIMPFKELKARLAARMLELRTIHAGLKYGNETMGLPGQNNRYPKLDALMYMPSCLLADQAACDALPLTRRDAYNYGVDNLVAVFLDKITDILKEADCIERNCEVASSLSRATSQAYAFIQESFGFLDVGLGKCIDLTVEESVSRIDVVYVVEGVILAFNMVSLAGLYLLMFRPMIKQLDDESTRRAQLLGMFPRVIIKDNAFLHKYFRGALSGVVAAGEEKKRGKASKHSESSSEDEERNKAK